MQQDPYQYPPTQQSQAPQPQQQPKKRSKRTVTALWLMIGPTALLIGAFVISAIINWLAPGASQPTDGSLFPERSPLEDFSTIFVFIAGAISVLTFLPGLIIGIVLLATRPRAN